MEDHVIELWTEIVQDSEEYNNFGNTNSTTVSLLSEFLQSAESFRIWDKASDENLRSILSIVNRMLNETRTTTTGLTLLNSFFHRITPSRFITVEDSLTSAVHLTVKNLDSNLAQIILTNFLPECHKFQDLNQVITTTIVPKILSHFCAKSKNSNIPTVDGINLLRVCLQKYHGPCGNFRTNLEKIFVPVIDHNYNDGATKSMLQILPLLSAAGGGGTKGDKHAQDWQQMVTKILKTMYDSLVLLFGDACTIFESQDSWNTEVTGLTLPDILEENVYIRFSLLKKRMMNLAKLLEFYLRDSFLAAKPVPQKSILSMIINMLLINPVDILKNFGNSVRKEFVFLASILPSVHQAAFRLLNSLIACVGGNIFIEAVRVEQLFLQELKWMFEKSDSFEDLKTEVYKTMLNWLKLTKSSVTSTKTVAKLIGFLKKDIQIEKEVVQLILLSKSKKKVKGHSRSLATHPISTTSGAGNIVSKNSTICQLTLELLTMLINGADVSSHQGLYKQVATIVVEFTQSTIIPSPYDDPCCRSNAFKCLLALAMHPHANSPVSLSLLISLVQQGRNDPVSTVATCCYEMSSLFERLVHPICPTLNFPTISMAATSDIPDDMPMVIDETEDSIIPPVETTESFCQTILEFEPLQDTTLNSSRNTVVSSFELDDIKETIVQTIQKSFDKLLIQNQLTNSHNSLVSERIFPEESLKSPPLQGYSSSSKMSMNGISTKRKALIDPEVTIPEEQITTKKLKAVENEGAYLEWLKDFVNVGPDV